MGTPQGNPPSEPVFPPLAATAAWMAGFLLCLGAGLLALPQIRDDAGDLYFRLGLAPAVGGALLWAGLAFAARFGPGGPGRAAGALGAWWSGIKKAWWGALILALFLGLAALGQVGQQKAGDRLVSFLAAQAQAGKGLLAMQHRKGGWASPPTLSWVESRVFHSSGSDPRFAGNDWNGRWLGLLRLPRDRRFQVALVSDDASLLLVDGVRVLENLGTHPPTRKTVELRLAAGEHAFSLLYWQKSGGAHLALEMDPAMAGLFKPARPGLDLGRLWRLERAAQIQRARVWLFLWAGAAWLALLLAPFGPAGLLAAWRWARPRGWLFLALAGAAALNAPGLDWFPGLEGDEAWAGAVAYYLHWWGFHHQPLSSYAWGYAMVYPFLWLQEVLPFSQATLRLVPLVGNLAGLWFCGLALWNFLGRRAALAGLALAGAMPWFIFGARHAVETYAFTMLCCGLALWALSLFRRGWWPAMACGAALGLGIQVHAQFLHFVAGVGLALALVSRLRVFSSGRFWLGLAALAAACWEELATLGRILMTPHGYTSAGALDLSSQVMSERGWTYLSQILPDSLVGRGVYLLTSGELLMPALPLAAGLLVLLLPWWPWSRRQADQALALRFLALAAVGCWLAATIISPKLSYRFIIGASLCLTLWLAVFLAGWPAGRLRKAALAALCLLALNGATLHLVNGLYAFSQSQGKLYDLETKSPSTGLWNSSSHYVSKRGLYRWLADQGRPVLPAPFWLFQPLIFHELEDSGRRGLYLVGSPPKEGGLLVFFRRADLIESYRLNRVEFLKKAASETGRQPRPLPLPPALANNFMAYELPRALARRNHKVAARRPAKVSQERAQPTISQGAR